VKRSALKLQRRLLFLSETLWGWNALCGLLSVDDSSGESGGLRNSLLEVAEDCENDRSVTN